jgi:hypothetical protein
MEVDERASTKFHHNHFNHFGQLSLQQGAGTGVLIFSISI